MLKDARGLALCTEKSTLAGRVGLGQEATGQICFQASGMNGFSKQMGECHTTLGCGKPAAEG